MVFLDIEKKAWVIRELEIPVIENIPMKELMWFRKKIKEANDLKKDPNADEVKALEFDEAWWEQVCQIGLGKTSEEIIDTGITPIEFRELMAEVYHFLATCSTIEGAKQSVLYAVETQEKESKP